MLTGKRYPILATIANWYILAVLYGAASAIVVAVVQRTPHILWSVSVSILTFIIVIVYQFRSQNFDWLSPGEIIVGRVSDQNGQKVWGNPWYVNRWALNLVMFSAMFLSGNAWDGVADGRIYPVGKIIVNIIVLGFLWGGFLATGRGSSMGLGLIVGYFVFTGGVLVILPSAAEKTRVEFDHSLGLVLLMVGVLSSVVAVVYHRLREKHAPNMDKSVDLDTT